MASANGASHPTKKRPWLSRWFSRRKAVHYPPSPVLIATYERKVRWTDLNNLIEPITFMLLEDQHGTRTWEVHEVGHSKIYKRHIGFLAPVRVWQLGGELPDGAIPQIGYKQRLFHSWTMLALLELVRPKEGRSK